VTIKIFVQPRSSKNMIAGLHGDAIKIKLTAPPVGGEANKMCVKFLSKCLGVPKSSLKIVSGQTSRTKRILIRSAEDKTSGNEHKRLENLVRSLVNSKKTT